MNDRIALGTAQFGLNYGVANGTGQITRESATEILRLAGAAGLYALDTAVAYGGSEQALGDIGVTGWRVITKLPALPADCGDAQGWVNAQVDASLARLKVGRLYGLLLHRPDQLLGSRGAALRDALVRQKTRGAALKVGVSIYRPDELDSLLQVMDLDLVQAPFNIFDRRLQETGWLRRLTSHGTEVHVRSAFLQGLLLMAPDKRPVKFRKWGPLWSRFDDWLRASRLTALQACLRYVLSSATEAKVVVGVDGASQLSGVLAAADGSLPLVPDFSSLTDPNLLDPSKWNQL